ncbi:uncharacterized protein LOC129302705 [Prosopis cineraria]|uniref:uncharacterized protein LOC129302705 n=1 Tax=Prosopis cineraria TaxID=364024 RepID=UPI00240FAF27|nr:uncharacterized protein LOC129302705 [Prosopis cineraria]
MWCIPEFELIDLCNNNYVVRFTDLDQMKAKYRKVLFEGPWVIMQHCVLIQRWSPYFNPFNNPLGQIAVWVRIPDIPMHCYNKKFIWRLGERIGRPLKVDMCTLSDISKDVPIKERGRYTPICVELDLQKKLVPKVIAACSVFNVESKGLRLICFNYGQFGHRRETCPWLVHGDTEKPQQVDMSSQTDYCRSMGSHPARASPMTNIKKEGVGFGSFMLPNASNYRISRFSVLVDEEQAEASGGKMSLFMNEDDKTVGRRKASQKLVESRAAPRKSNMKIVNRQILRDQTSARGLSNGPITTNGKGPPEYRPKERGSEQHPKQRSHIVVQGSSLNLGQGQVISAQASSKELKAPLPVNSDLHSKEGTGNMAEQM